MLLIALVMFSAIYSLDIEYFNSNERDKLIRIDVEGQNYYSINEIRRVFKTANHFVDYEHNKLNFSIFDESIILYLNTFFVSSRGRLSNVAFPFLQKQGEFLVPESFFTQTLPNLFPDKFKWNIGKKVLKTERPIDRKIKTIVVDPGHGGRDPGALGKRYHEKNVTLAIAKILKAQLEKELNVQVLLTRSTDEFVSLQDRTKFANKNNGDLFISLHCNGSKAKSANGIEVFFLSAARTDDERAIEALENSVVMEFEGGHEAVQAYDDLQFILADLMQSEQLEESSDLAVRLQTELIRKTTALDRGVKQAGFYVLRGAFMPSVLVELGFISNEKEENQMMTPAYQDKLVSAIVSGIKSFKLKYDFLW